MAKTMLNGSLVVCSKLVIETTEVSTQLDLKGLFTGRASGKAFEFDVYGWWAPEKIGSVGCELTWRKRSNPHTVAPKHLHYHDIQVTAEDVKSQYFGLYFTKIFMPPQDPGEYVVDLVIDGIIVASHPIRISEKQLFKDD